MPKVDLVPGGLVIAPISDSLSHLVELCTYGEKKDPIGAKAYIDPQNDVLATHLVGRVTKGLPVEIDFSRASQTAVEANGIKIKVYGITLDVAGEYSYKRLKTARLKLMNFSIDAGPLQTMLNTVADGARNFLASDGTDGRIVSEVWVVMEAALAYKLHKVSNWNRGKTRIEDMEADYKGFG